MDPLSKRLPRRLLIDCTTAGRRMTGIERYATEAGGSLAAAQRQLGVSVTVLLGRGGEAHWLQYQTSEGLDLRESPFTSVFLTQQLWLPYQVLRLRPDVAWFPCFPPSPLVFLGRTRVIRTIFDGFIWSKPNTMTLKNALYYKPLETWGSHYYSLVHTISEHARADIERHLPWLEGRVVSSGAGASRLPEPSGDGAAAFGVTGPYLLFVGTIEPRKNLPFLLKVFSQVRLERPDLKLVLAGRFGWATDEVIRNRKAAGLEDSVVLTGSISDSILSALYSGATALTYPSLREGFGLPVVEAMSRGLPVISSNTTSLPEVCGDAATLIPPDDERAWLQAIRDVLASPEKRERMAAAGREQARKFDWETVAGRIAETL